MPAVATPLKLIAFDADDLAVLSAHLQDALVRVADMAHLGAERRFALVCARFDWTAAGAPRRIRSGLHFDGVRRVSVAKLRREEPEAVLNLLSIGFEPTEAPAGIVTLTFSAGVAVRLECEYLEAAMADISEPWAVALAPGHKIDTA